MKVTLGVGCSVMHRPSCCWGSVGCWVNVWVWVYCGKMDKDKCGYVPRGCYFRGGLLFIY